MQALFSCPMPAAMHGPRALSEGFDIRHVTQMQSCVVSACRHRDCSTLWHDFTCIMGVHAPPPGPNPWHDTQLLPNDRKNPLTDVRSAVIAKLPTYSARPMQEADRHFRTYSSIFQASIERKNQEMQALHLEVSFSWQ